MPKKKYILTADIGGTKSRFAVVEIKKTKPHCVCKISIKSNTIKSFAATINTILKQIKEKHDISITTGSFAVAGQVSAKKDFVKITNLTPNIDKKEILKKTPLKKIFLFNDFEAIGYAISHIPKKYIVKINTAKAKKGNIAIIGAGTGLGKAFLIWNKAEKKYTALPSEGGHGDFAAQTQQECDLCTFIKKQKGRKNTNVEIEDLVSGKGITNIYKFLRATKKYKATQYTKEIEKNKYDPKLISKYKNKDRLCKHTFELFARFYARVAKNSALQILATGGVYIVGKLSAQNIDIFTQKSFLDEFYKSYKFKTFLKQIPVFVVKDYKLGLYGAALLAQ